MEAKIKEYLAEHDLTPEDLTAEELEALKEEMAQKEAGILFLDGVLSNPEIYYRKAFNTKK